MDAPTPEANPFHVGERAVQARFGVAERMAQAGARAIRSFMPEQHRAFFAQLPYALIGATDRSGALWASMLSGPPGFIATPDPRLLTIETLPSPSDPLAGALSAGTAIGVLGIDLATRRRNRANGTVLSSDGEVPLRIAVAESFGNCPQYIWPRQIPADAACARRDGAAEELAIGHERVRDLIARADTAFIASRSPGPDAGAAGRVDVSHRGGEAGFLRIHEDALVWPEYRGNFYFNTLGNLSIDPVCGLLVPDFETGDLLHLAGTAALHWPDGAVTDGGLRINGVVRFTPARILLRRAAIPPAWHLLGPAAVSERAFA